MTHFICVECKGISDTPGICKTEECPRLGADLAECNCTDGEHKSAIAPELEKDEIDK